MSHEDGSPFFPLPRCVDWVVYRRRTRKPKARAAWAGQEEGKAVDLVNREPSIEPISEDSPPQAGKKASEERTRSDEGLAGLISVNMAGGYDPTPAPVVTVTKAEDDSPTATGVRPTCSVKQLCPSRMNAEISARYDFDNELGAGAFGSVFVARDKRQQDRKVAVKKMLILDGEQKEAFEKEAKIMKDLDHPNICRLLEVALCSSSWSFARAKTCLTACWSRRSGNEVAEHSFGEPQAAEIIRQASSALHYAHNRMISHRDIKPENMVFVNRDSGCNHIKVIDWGLGFYFGDRRMKSAVGSLQYCAPEVLQADHWSKWTQGYSQACDLWSLGVCTYVMLCGKPPFWGHQAQQLKMMKKEKFPMDDAIWQAISPEAKDPWQIFKDPCPCSLLRVNQKKRLPLDKVLSHPWFTVQNLRASQISQSVAKRVLSNMRNFSRLVSRAVFLVFPEQFFWVFPCENGGNLGHFHSICVAAVARQLDSRNLHEVHSVFCNLDRNGDGVLTLEEVKEGFSAIFLPNSCIDYTEFCAAGVGERVFLEESALWGAFDAFDAGQHDGQITLDEIKTVLSNADVKMLR
eukprot:g32954.t1